MAPMFKDWCFEANKGTQTDFILNREKNFHVSDLRNSSNVDSTSNLMSRYTHRISGIKIDLKGELLRYLKKYPSDFKQLTSLDLHNVDFKNNSLLILAPQLEYLRLSNMKNPEFDISSVDENSKCFTKLKTLKLLDGKINVIKILTQCSKTLEYLEFRNYGDRILDTYLEEIRNDFPSLKYLYITLTYFECVNLARVLLSKCHKNLRTLNLNARFTEIDLSNLFEQPMNITTLEVDMDRGNFGNLLNKCPKVQNLVINGYDKEIKEFVLKDLNNLGLVRCRPQCTASVLKQASKSSLKTLYFFYQNSGCEFPVIPELEVVRIGVGLDSLEYNEVFKLFPQEAKVIFHF
jgi:hypothetical protein